MPSPPPQSPSSELLESTKVLLSKYHQTHLLTYASVLPPASLASLLQQINSLDFHNLFEVILPPTLDLLSQTKGTSEPEVTQPFPFSDVSQIPTTIDEKELRKKYAEIGQTAIINQQVATIILAGGQGTRLSHPGAKGTFVPPLLPSKQSLFDVIIRRGIAVGCKTYYIMVSEFNDAETQDYFKARSYYDLDPTSFYFFRQGVLPSMSLVGDENKDSYPKIHLASMDSLNFSPNGNGSLYPSLYSTGALADMESKGIKHIHCIGIDNILAIPSDPTFIGYCINKESSCGNKVLWKTSPDEKVGVMCLDTSGKPKVIEYSDMNEASKYLKDGSGKLVYGAGNICNHYFSMEFLKSTCEHIVEHGIPYHVAYKKINVIDFTDATGNTRIDVNDGVKLESFIFDVFPLAHGKFSVMEVKRDDEFSPVKNADNADSSLTNIDSPKIAVTMMSSMCKRWINTRATALLRDDASRLKGLTRRLESYEYVEVDSRVCWEEGGVEGITEEHLAMVEVGSGDCGLYIR